MSALLDPNETFHSLFVANGIDPRIKKAVARLGHSRPTLVQAKCLPLAIQEGRDLVVRAKTGSGKTLAYTIPLLQKVLQAPNNNSKQRHGQQHAHVKALILLPTRELCRQVEQVLQKLIYYCDDVVKHAVLSSGSTQGEKNKQEMERQEAMLRDKPNVVIATPAGLLAQIRKGNIDLKNSLETIVVDEADLILSFGYSKDIAEIVKALPRICQGFLMSATLSPEIDALKKVVLHSPVVLKLENEDQDAKQTAGRLKQFYLSLPRKDKYLVTYVFLKLGLLKGKGLFFVNSTDAGYRLKLFLEQFHIRSAVLNQELPFTSRMNIVEQFNVGNFDYLIATDSSADVNDQEDDSSDDDNVQTQKLVKGKRRRDSEYGVSRGLDFRNVSFVVNYDFPPNKRSYAHRVGRTARGGAKGVALSFVENESREQEQCLLDVQEDQPTIPLEKANSEKLQALPSGLEQDHTSGPVEQAQPMPLDFDLHEIEGFRYRVEDVSRAVTKLAVKETRAAELRAEILNSERLQSHFEENPADLQILAHDRIATHVSKVQDHLKHVPKYLLPRGMQVASVNGRRKKKRVRKGTGGERRSDNDPLQNFDGENADLGDFTEDPLVDDGEEPDSKKPKVAQEEGKVFTSTTDGTGRSTAGRTAWKEKHRKGKFSSKKRLKDKKRKEPLGI